jgi:fused signal recognition particle receptor
MFHEALDLTGIVLTKLDSTSKGGIVVQIIDELKVPVKYIGIGEGLEDLKVFNPEEFAKALF